MAASLDSRLARTKLVILMDSDIASVVSLVDLFQTECCDAGNAGFVTLNLTINQRLDRINDSVGCLQTPISSSSGDGDFLGFLSSIVRDLKSMNNVLYENRMDEKTKKIDHDRLIIKCTEFKSHLDALRLLYDTCIPQLMENILESMDKIQHKLCEPQ